MVTSPTGAALRDVLEVTGRRWPGIPILVSPTRVQGPGAEDEIAAALDDLVGGADVSLVLLVRGNLYVHADVRVRGDDSASGGAPRSRSTTTLSPW